MSDAFRSGYITADDIMQRTDARGQAKRKAEIATATLQAKQAEDQLGNQALAMAAAKSRMEHDKAITDLGPGGLQIQALFAKAGLPIPMIESTLVPGTKSVDMAKVNELTPEIFKWDTEQQRKAKEYSGWKSVEVPNQQTNMMEQKFWNEFQGPRSLRNDMPRSDAQSFFDWKTSGGQTTAPGTVAGASVVQPATPPAAAPGAVVPPQAGLPIKPLPNANRDLANDVHTRFSTDPVVKDAKIASTAYTAAEPVLRTIQPDGTYNPKSNILPKQADYNLLVAYAKILDPNSVVREGEIKLLDGTASSLMNLSLAKKDASFSDLASKLIGQTKFTQQERNSFRTLLTGAYQNRMTQANEVKNIHKAELTRLGITDPGQVESLLTLREDTSPAAGGAPSGRPVAKTITLSDGTQVDLDAYGQKVGMRPPAAGSSLVQPKSSQFEVPRG
jgi:hypothetical protein